MMVQSLVPTPSKTDEILSRYRPIAPKPDLPPPSTATGLVEEPSNKLRHSPYLRNIWAHLQTRPSRSRKRGRAPHHHSSNSNNNNSNNNPFCLSNNYPPPMITLPLLSTPSKTTPIKMKSCMGLEEKDLILQLKSPSLSNPTPCSVIAPKVVRPVGSTIKVGPLSVDGSSMRVVVVMRHDEVEAAAEEEALPVLISDSRNRVRVANSAYREMVGQPECRWLDELMGVRRIGGEVIIQIPGSGSGLELPVCGFSCWARIEWGNKGLVDAFCDVVRLNCVTKDYMFSWRFHI